MFSSLPGRGVPLFLVASCPPFILCWRSRSGQPVCAAVCMLIGAGKRSSGWLDLSVPEPSGRFSSAGIIKIGFVVMCMLSLKYRFRRAGISVNIGRYFLARKDWRDRSIWC